MGSAVDSSVSSDVGEMLGTALGLLVGSAVGGHAHQEHPHSEVLQSNDNQRLIARSTAMLFESSFICFQLSTMARWMRGTWSCVGQSFSHLPFCSTTTN